MTHAILLGPDDWQVNITDGEYICVATGETIECALIAAQAKANEGKYTGSPFHIASLRFPEAKVKSAEAGRSLLSLLGLGKASIRRRI